MNLQQKIETCCQRAGFKAEKRSYKPHITFGRVKGAAAKQVKEFIESKKARSLFLQTEVDHFNLYRSELNKTGAIHHVIDEYLLEG